MVVMLAWRPALAVIDRLDLREVVFANRMFASKFAPHSNRSTRTRYRTSKASILFFYHRLSSGQTVFTVQRTGSLSGTINSKLSRTVACVVRQLWDSRLFHVWILHSKTGSVELMLSIQPNAPSRLGSLLLMILGNRAAQIESSGDKQARLALLFGFENLYPARHGRRSSSKLFAWTLYSW